MNKDKKTLLLNSYSPYTDYNFMLEETRFDNTYKIFILQNKKDCL